MEFLLIAVVLLGGLGLWLKRRWPKGRGDSDDFFMGGGSGDGDGDGGE